MNSRVKQWGAFFSLACLLASCASDQTTRTSLHPSRNGGPASRSRDSRGQFPPARSAPVSPPAQTAASTPTVPLTNIMSVESATVPAHLGLVVPLSGPLAAIGQQILRGTRLGLNLEKGFDSAFQIFLVDSELPEAKLREEVENVIFRDQVIAVVSAGKNVSLVSEIGEKARVPVVLFSQRSTPAASVETFRNFLTTETQILYLVSELRAQGAQKFAVLYPNDGFGVEATNFFWDAVLASGGQVTEAQPYETKERDFRLPVQRLLGLDDVAARALEYKESLKAWQEANKDKRNAKDPGVADLLKPWVDFDAVFVPDGITNLGQISAMLSFQGVRDLKIVGLNLWDSPELLKRVDGKFNPILFVDDFSTLEETGVNHPFTSFYRTHFHFDPQNFDILGFETATALKKIMNKGVRSREAMRQELMRYEDSQGMFGPLAVTTGREFDHALSIYTLNDGHLHKKLMHRVPIRSANALFW